MRPEPLLDRKLLERLERLTIYWQKSFAGLVGGHNPSRFAGPGQEFLDHRNFHSGDDLRAVNWRAYMRLDKLFLKMFQVEPRVPVRLLLDVSDSMQTGTPNKFDYACRLAGALCYVGLVRLDAITLQPFGDGLGESCLSSGGRHRFNPVLDFLGRLKPGGRTDMRQIVRQFLDTYPQRGLTIIVSDFMDDADLSRPLQYLSDFGHEVQLVHVWAPDDRTPPWDGELRLTDAETGQHFDATIDDDARQRYTAAFDAYADNLRRLAQRAGGRYHAVSTDAPLEDVVFTSLQPVPQGVA